MAGPAVGRWEPYDGRLSRTVLTEAGVETTPAYYPTFFDPSGEARDTLAHTVNTVATRLRVLLLNPACEAAKKRQEIELGNATIADINHTIDNGLQAVAAERLADLQRATPGRDILKLDLAALQTELKMEVRLYSVEPIAFVMMFDHTLFHEQYHRGRPAALVPIGSCIGKFMPVLQYRRGSMGFTFLESHFDQIWNDAEEITQKILSEAIRRAQGRGKYEPPRLEVVK